MNAKEFAQLLDGREGPYFLPTDLARQAKASGLVVVYGVSDDILKVEGAVDEEFACITGGAAAFEVAGKPVAVIAKWCEEPGCCWSYSLSVAHEVFRIIEDGEVYCRGVVFSVADL